jgi:cytoskeletal protein CcmA (bactofilin family)
MNTYRTLFITLFLTSSFLFSQDTSSTDRDDEYTNRTSDDVEQFINDIVSRVESGVNELIEKRSNESYDNGKEVASGSEFDSSGESDAVTFNGDTEIAEGDTIQGDLVVKYGTLTVRGAVNGDILVVNGSIVIKSTAHIKGNVRSMNGSIIKDDGAIVEGYTEQSSKSKYDRRKKTARVRYSHTFKPYYWIEQPLDDDNFLFRYNRVEGLFLGLGSQKKFYWDGDKKITGFGSFGYGFAMHKWRLQLGLDRQFLISDGVLFETGGEVHSSTDTKDEWRMNLGENNLAALFFREDFRDYFQREGFSVHTARYTKDGDISTMVDARYNADRYKSLYKEANWALFGGDRVFRSNPFINEGMIRSISLTAGVSTLEKYRNRSEGWDLYGRAEYGGKNMGGDFDFNQVIIDMKRFQQLSDYDQISIRVRVGSLEGDPILQKTFELGGANTMPAYGFKEFAGNRMVLGNLEYQLEGETIDDVFFWPHSLNLILFGDAGATTSASTKKAVYDGFDNITTSMIKSDIGFGFGWNEAGARLGFAWRTDKSAPVAIFFRLNRAF